MWNSITSAACALDLCFKTLCVWSFMKTFPCVHASLCVWISVRLKLPPQQTLPLIDRHSPHDPEPLIGRKMMKRRGVGGECVWVDAKLKECGRWLGKDAKRIRQNLNEHFCRRQFFILICIALLFSSLHSKAVLCKGQLELWAMYYLSSGLMLCFSNFCGFTLTCCVCCAPSDTSGLMCESSGFAFMGHHLRCVFTYFIV